MAPNTLNTRDEFTNTTEGWVGAVQIDHLNQAHGISVEPGGSVFLNEDEQMLTANAPRADADNPFLTGALELRTRAVEMKNRRPYGGAAATPVTPPEPTPTAPEVEETGATPTPVEPEPEVGVAAPGEEVATPGAARARMGRKKTPSPARA